MRDDTGSEELTDDDDTDDEDIDEEEDEEQYFQLDVFNNRVRMTIRFLVLLEERQERRLKDDPFKHLSWNVHEATTPLYRAQISKDCNACQGVDGHFFHY
tara:strand:+ start:1276 stop:1575 length:300 start_codon:yes stop_codon:yes gene_type:complete